MSFQEVALDVLIEPAPLERAGNRDLPILSMTMHEGLVDQRAKFKKRVASANTAAYKLVRRNQLVVGFPIDEGVLSFQNLYDEAIVSPAYNTWRLRADTEVEPAYLERFLRSPRALAFYRTKLRGTTARRRTLPSDIFLRLAVPLPPLLEQRRIAAILDKTDALRAKRRAALAYFDTLTQSLFLDMFGDPAMCKLPLGNLIKLKSGRFLPAKEMVDSGPYSVFGGNGINGFHDRYMFEDSQIVIGRVGVYCGCVHASPPKSWVTDNALYVSEWSPRLRFEYLLHALTHARLNQYASQSGQPLVSGSRIYPVGIVVPPEELQVAFEVRIASSGKLKRLYDAAISKVDVLFEALQHRAFRGEL